MKNPLSRWNELPAFFRNKYILVTLAFLIWMLFFDNYNLFVRSEIRGELREVRQKKAYYEAQIEEVKTELNSLFGSEESLEKFAREKYYMKRADEDVFIIVDE